MHNDLFVAGFVVAKQCPLILPINNKDSLGDSEENRSI